MQISIHYIQHETMHHRHTFDVVGSRAEGTPYSYYGASFLGEMIARDIECALYVSSDIERIVSNDFIQ